MGYLITILSAILFTGCGQEPDRPSGRYSVFCPGIPKSFRVYLLSDGKTVDPSNMDMVVQIPKSGNCVWRQHS